MTLTERSKDVGEKEDEFKNIKIMLWVPGTSVHRQYGNRAKLNRKNHKQENQKYAHEN